MPIYEEKLICPLAVRFSQDHIRPEFQNGQDMEKTIKAIKTKPATGDYDIILEPPFPAIEIIQGHLKHADGSNSSEMWLSLDNRRLYCLQRAAIAHWPMRVAVEVEALKAPTADMRKKVNSSVGGMSVGIGHSPKELIARWDWSDKVPEGPEGEEAVRVVALDEARATIEALQDAPAPPSMLDIFYANEKAGGASDSSTVEPRSPRGSEDSNDSSVMYRVDAGTAWQESAGDWMPDMSGAWEDDQGNSYSVTYATAESCTCLRNGGGSRRKVSLWYDAATDSVSWGDDWSYWADAASIRNGSDCMSWYASKDTAKRNLRFQWWRIVQTDKAVAKQRQTLKQSAKKAGQKVGQKTA
jgi:hypothetical protein